MRVLKVTTVGNSAGVILPKEILERLRVSKGDELYLVEEPDGYKLTPYNREFADQMTGCRAHHARGPYVLRSWPSRGHGRAFLASLRRRLAIHNLQLAEHGGPIGIRDEGLLESALAAPQNRWRYERAASPNSPPVTPSTLPETIPLSTEKTHRLCLHASFPQLNGWISPQTHKRRFGSSWTLQPAG